MDLQLFIQETLVAIVKGIKGANTQLDANSAHFRSRVDPANDDLVEFDIAVTVSNANESKKQGGGKITVASVFSAELGGSKGKTYSDQTVSRIKFKVGNGRIIA